MALNQERRAELINPESGNFICLKCYTRFDWFLGLIKINCPACACRNTMTYKMWTILQNKRKSLGITKENEAKTLLGLKLDNLIDKHGKDNKRNIL